MQRGLALILIILLIAVSGIGGYFVITSLSSNSWMESEKELLKQHLTPTTSTIPDETANWKTYTNTKVGYSIKYPDYLVLKETTLPAASPDYPEVLGTAVLSNPSIENHFSISITLGKTTKKLTLDNILGNGPQLSYINDFLKNKKVSKLSVGGTKAIMVQDITVGPGDGLVTDLIIIRGDLVYQVTLFNSGNENNKLFNQILSTFKFTQ